jgi:hypothetical protein
MGWGSFSETLEIEAAKVPDKPLPPVITLENINMRISWTDPYMNSSPVLAYRIFIANNQDVYSEELLYCDGRKDTVLANKYCEVPMDILRGSAYKLEFDSILKAKIQVSNVYGWSELSDNNVDGARIQTEPQ